VGIQMQEMKNSKLREKERLPLLAHKEKNARKKMTIEFTKGVQCANLVHRHHE